MIKLKTENIEICDLTLLSKEEFYECQFFVPSITDGGWWLRDADPTNDCNVFYVNNSNLNEAPKYYYRGVRPLCIFINVSSIKIDVGDKIKLGGYIWTAIDVKDNNKKVKILCDEIVEVSIFDLNTNVFIKSELFDWLQMAFLTKIIEN